MGGRVSAVQFSLQAAPQDTINASISPSVINISADADGHPLAAASYKSIVATMYKGKTAVNDAKIIKVNGTTTTPQTVGGVSIQFSSSQNAVYSYTTGSTVSSASVEVVVYSASLNAERTVTLSVVATRKGSQGIQGLSNAVLVRRGKFTGAELDALTIVNSADRVDYIYYRPNSSSPWQKYRLKTNIASWDSTGYTNSSGNKTTTVSPFRPDSDNYTTSTSSVCWVKFNQLNDISTNFIIADAVSAASANIIEAFIGETKNGVTENEDGTFTLTNEACGWAIKAGKIYHTQSGLELTKEGYIIDPDGLHLRVGGKLIDKSVNLLPWATLDDEGFTAGTYMSYETVVGSYTPLGKKMFVVNNSSGSSLSYKSINGDIRVQLKPNTTYRFSVFVSLSGTGYNQNQNVYGTLQLYDAPEDGNYISSSFTSTFAYNGAATQIISWQFTTDSTHTWFIPNLLLPSVLQGRIVIIRGVMLTLGPTAPTAYTSPSITNIIQSALLATGIDIEDQVINLIANQFNCFNNSGEKTAFLDKRGNFTIAGVLNNMIATLAPASYADYGSFYDQTGLELFLNPLFCPMYLKCNVDQRALTIHLPSYRYDQTDLPIKTKVYVEGDGDIITRFTLDELRQMVGKKIIIMPTNVKGTSSPSLTSHNLYYKYRTYNSTPGGLEQIGQYGAQVSEWLEEVGTLFFYLNNQTRILRAECKAGLYDSRECIYWEVDEVGAAL